MLITVPNTLLSPMAIALPHSFFHPSPRLHHLLGARKERKCLRASAPERHLYGTNEQLPLSAQPSKRCPQLRLPSFPHRSWLPGLAGFYDAVLNAGRGRFR